MNRVVVGQAAAGLAAYLLDQGLAGGTGDHRLRRPAQVRRVRPRHRRDLGRRRLPARCCGRSDCPRRWSPSASGTSAAWPAWWSPPRTTRRRTTATRSTWATAPRSCRRPTARSPPRIAEVAERDLADVPRSAGYAHPRRRAGRGLPGPGRRAGARRTPRATLRLGLHPAARRRRTVVDRAVAARRLPGRRGGRRAGRARPRLPHGRLPQPGGAGRDRPGPGPGRARPAPTW